MQAQHGWPSYGGILTTPEKSNVSKKFQRKESKERALEYDKCQMKAEVGGGVMEVVRFTGSVQSPVGAYWAFLWCPVSGRISTLRLDSRLSTPKYHC
ncbi:hypothetical protein PM082_010096 [Marasmius tenuissimus]|nr:hypothetical protein PM082_010096 [Marasmius tenuissimus]